jgi:hypothetical protein
MVTHLLLDLNLDIKQIESLDLNNNDPHHHEWSTSQVKKILSAELLIAPPLELNPGLSSLLERRKKPSLILKVRADEKRFSHSHFWFYPEVSCEFRQQIETYLKRPASKCPYQNIALPLLKYSLIVVSHEAIAPLFEQTGIPLIVLQSAREGEQTSTKLKALSLELDKNMAKPILWIKESPYHGKIKLERYTKKEDKIVEVKLLSQKDLFFSLKSLVTALEKAP